MYRIFYAKLYEMYNNQRVETRKNRYDQMEGTRVTVQIDGILNGEYGRIGFTDESTKERSHESKTSFTSRN